MLKPAPERAEELNQRPAVPRGTPSECYRPNVPDRAGSHVSVSHQQVEGRCLSTPALHAFPLAVLSFNREGVVVTAAGGLLEEPGRQPAELIGTCLHENQPGLPPLGRHVERCLAGERVAALVRFTGGAWDLRLEPVTDTDGTTVGGRAAAWDATAYRQADQQRHVHAEWLGILDEQLQQARRMREELLTVIAHELRTPLTPLVGGIELLRHGYPPDSRQAEALVASMRRSINRLQRMVNNLAMLSDGQRGAVAVCSRPTVVGPIAARALETLAAPTGAVQLEGHLDATAWVDPDHLDLMCRELLRNAMTYGGSPISLSVRPADDRIEVSVSDRGPGISDSLQPRLFTPFEQADRSLNRSARGLGIGLAAVRLLAELNGGTVDLDPNHRPGARFRLCLPASANGTQLPPADLGHDGAR